MLESLKGPFYIILTLGSNTIKMSVETKIVFFKINNEITYNAGTHTHKCNLIKRLRSNLPEDTF